MSTDDYKANIQTSGHVSIDGSVTGKLEAINDADWFSVYLTAGQGYIFKLESTSSGGLDDPYLEFCDASGKVLATDDDSGPSGVDPLMTYIAKESGTYFLAASSADEGTGAYVLSALTEDYLADTHTTGKVTMGSSSTGNLEIVDDTDWFAVTLTSGQNYTFKLDSAGSSGLDDPYLELYDASGKALDEDDDSGASGANALLTYSATASGTYFLAAGSGTSGEGTGAYQISAAVIPDDYTASKLTTGRASVGGSVTGNLEMAEDADWFAITLTSGQNYTFKLDSASSGGLEDPYLKLHDANGKTLAEDDDSGASGVSSQLTYTPTQTGKYFLAASSGASGTGTGAYLLSTEMTAAPATTTPTTPATTTPTTTTPTTTKPSTSQTPPDTTNTNNVVADMLASTAGNDTLDGGAGIDTALYTGIRANFTLTQSGTSWIVFDSAGIEGSDTLTNVERLSFSDTKVALDIMDGNAGKTVQILGAVFGPTSISNKAYVGLGLSFLDSGMNYQSLMQLALNAKLGETFSHADEVNLLYQNLVGSLPSVADLDYWTGELASGKLTPASLAVMASNLDLNAANIDLVGLAQSGIEYA